MRTVFSTNRLLGTSLVAQTLKSLPTMRETRVQSLGWEDLLEKEMATHSSILAWKIPWTEKPGRLQSLESQRVGHDWATSLSLSFQQIELLKLDTHMYKNEVSVLLNTIRASLVAQLVKNPLVNAGDSGLILGLGRPPEEGKGSPPQYSCLENPVDREPGGLQSVGSPKSQTRLSD